MQEEIKARKRDYGVCVECRKKGIYKYASIIKKVDDIKPHNMDNLICLCDECSNKQEKKETKKNGK